jgi:transposase, IS5 family
MVDRRSRWAASCGSWSSSSAPAGRYQTLVREVSDSLHLRRFCLLPLTQRVPDESTVRKLVRRLGPETVNELTRVVIGKAQRETRFRARAVRIDATVAEADIRCVDELALW